MEPCASSLAGVSLTCLPLNRDNSFEAALAEEDALAQELLRELLCAGAFATFQLASTHLLKERQEAIFDLISSELRRSGRLMSDLITCCPSLPAGTILPACPTSGPEPCQ
ncbi:hypothetical protein ABPG77_001589 [Micractinium sp. CCAP 211/92]